MQNRSREVDEREAEPPSDVPKLGPGGRRLVGFSIRRVDVFSFTTLRQKADEKRVERAGAKLATSALELCARAIPERREVRREIGMRGDGRARLSGAPFCLQSRSLSLAS